MFSASGRPRRASLAIGIAAYAIIIAFTAATTTHVVWRAGAALLSYLAPAAEIAPGRDVAAGTRAARAAMSVPGAAPAVRRSQRSDHDTVGGSVGRYAGAARMAARSRAYGGPPRPRSAPPRAIPIADTTARMGCSARTTRSAAPPAHSARCACACATATISPSASQSAPTVSIATATYARAGVGPRGGCSCIPIPAAPSTTCAILPAGPTASCARPSSTAPSTCRAAPASPSPGTRPRRIATASTRWPSRPARAARRRARSWWRCRPS